MEIGNRPSELRNSDAAISTMDSCSANTVTADRSSSYSN
jgi:hypothetical protein